MCMLWMTTHALHATGCDAVQIQPKPLESGVAGKDIAFTLDNLNRMNNAQWGTWNGTSIGSEVRERAFSSRLCGGS